jgi:hypothetical protein
MKIGSRTCPAGHRYPQLQPGGRPVAGVPGSSQCDQVRLDAFPDARFEAGGWDEVDTCAEIAKEAGVGVGTVYRHFPARDELIEAAARQAPQHAHPPGEWAKPGFFTRTGDGTCRLNTPPPPHPRHL